VVGRFGNTAGKRIFETLLLSKIRCVLDANAWCSASVDHFTVKMTESLLQYFVYGLRGSQVTKRSIFFGPKHSIAFVLVK